ncbi:hypothetical protein [Bacillus sp. SM2101]|uniref:hypothetical protein n=1 Tax=Bacillus sp. SM2101 TaxID=2805366 RepID=UPI001BDED53D|nr:hypothetical protein [Bacillus sp. SM2101]
MNRMIYFSLSFLLLVSLVFTGCKAETAKVDSDNERIQTDWTVRQEYSDNGETLFTVYPDPTLVAGRSYGYMISFTAPFETFNGKTIEIEAYHKETGKRINAIPPQTITEPTSGYDSLNRFTVSFMLPLSGLWRYEVRLDGETYGDVILAVGEA